MNPQWPSPYAPNAFGRFLGGVDGAAPPQFGSPFQPGDACVDHTNGILYICTVGGNTGTWISAGSGVQKIGAAIDLAPIATVDGILQQLVIAPDGGTIFTNWNTGLTFNASNNALVVTVKGRYLVGMWFSIAIDLVTALFLQANNSHSTTGGVGAVVPAGAAAGSLTFSYAAPTEVNVGDEIAFFVGIYGKNYSILDCLCWVQYVGPATSI